MEKKPHLRKRDRIWNFFRHKKHVGTLQRRDTTTEQKEKITCLSAYAQQHFSLSLDSDIFESLLEDNDWDLKKAIADLSDYEEASHGILVEPPQGQVLLGPENDGGTSCYIDALLFAMYISNTTFDPLLTYDIPPENEAKVKLQTVMRLFVNKLRKGNFISANYVHWLRKVLEEAQWNGKDENGYWSQEDTSELFMFITETFDLPYLPFQIRLFHGANHDTNDDRVMTDRVLSLSIPQSNMNTRLKLEDILLDYFYNNIITGIKRQVDIQLQQQQQNINQDISEDILSSPTFASTSEKKKTLEPTNTQQEVIAWQVLELLPFYSATNEQGELINTQFDSAFPDTRMILPIVLKRYFYENTEIKKNKIPIDIPSTIDFNRFINQNMDDPVCTTCGQMNDWTLYLKSVVCHKGSSPYSGHYISYARAEEEWIKLDDMNKEMRVTLVKDQAKMFADLAENAYILFYELDKTCQHHNDNNSHISNSSGNSINNSNNSNNKPSLEKAPLKDHHHHHYSCILM